MDSTEKTISALVGQQLPDFVRADNPQFKRFIELYYDWLEKDGTFTASGNTYSYGNTVYHIMNAEKYRDIDETLDPFVRLFKQEFLPYFPEKTELDLVKILKGAREFYAKKGSIESLKWLFRVLFNQEVEIYYPKEQILIASDGKWKLPQAFQLTLSEENENINPNLLERHKGIGSESKASCVIESANKTIDSTFGNEILEIYVSNANREFINGENLEIEYVDENGQVQLFSEKIVGAISGIRIDSNIKTDPQQKRRGLTYNVGDPVVVFGGLDDTPVANDAVAVVGNITQGSIESVVPVFGGYGYRIYSNTEVIVYRSAGDDPNANLSTDIRIGGISTINIAGQSQISFKEDIIVDKMPIEFLEGVVLDAADYTVFTQNNRNIILDATEADADDPYDNLEQVWANGASYVTANFKGYIATSNSSGFGQGGPAYTGNLIIYAVSNTVPLTTTGFLTGQLLYTANTNKSFTINSVDETQLQANIDSIIAQALNYEKIETGAVALFNVINGGYGFRTTPTIEVSSYFDTYLSENFDYETEYALKKQFRQPIGAFGQVAHVYINSAGVGYSNGDAIVLSGRGYDFAGYVNVNSTGSIVFTTITNRGEGYFGNKTVTVSSSGGSNAILTAYGFGEGEVHEVETSAIGRVRDIRILSRGFDYASVPVVSLKVVDMVITPLGVGETLTPGERVYQGGSLETAIFTGIVPVGGYNTQTNALRLFNYSGNSFNNFDTSLEFTSEGGVNFFVDTTKRVAAPTQYPAEVRALGLPNPWFYGNGRAKAIAEFYNGLIKFPGFYLNTDGFVSADKKLQDSGLYHNFSYVIESEKSTSDYRNSVMDIVHPIGTEMYGRTVTKAEFSQPIKSNSTVYINEPNATGSNVYIVDSESVVVSGNLTEFESAAQVGDLFLLIDPNTPLRSQAKLITVIDSDESLNVESNFVYIGQGKVTGVDGETYVTVSGNTNSISQFMQSGDNVSFVADETTVEYTISNLTGDRINFTSPISGNCVKVVYQVIPNYYTENYEYEIIKVQD